MSNSSKAVRQTRQNIVASNTSQSTVALTADDAQRIEDANNAIQDMNTALRAVFEDLKGSFQTNDSTGITFFYQIGTALLDVKEDRDGAVYGKGGYAKLCKALAYNKGLADKACVFAKQYDPSEVRGLASLRNNVTGKGLTSEHLRHLLVDYLSDSLDPDTKLRELKERRQSYIQRCIGGSWTAKQLKDVIMSENNRESVGGRPHVVLGKDASLQKLSRYYINGNNAMTKSWLNDEANIVTLLTTNLEDVTPDTLTLYDEALHELEVHKQFLDALIQQLHKAEIHQLYVDRIGGRVVESKPQSSGVETAGTSTKAAEPLELDLPDM